MFHPIVRLVFWGVTIVLIQFLPLAALAIATGVALLSGFVFAPYRVSVLLKRTRWLLISLVLLFSLGTPGIFVFPSLGSLGPTREGLLFGVEHLLRLLFLVATLAILLQSTGVDGLVSGLYGMIRPLTWLGLDRARIAVRLLLVLQYVEASHPGRHWREWLEREDCSLQPVHLQRMPLQTSDVAVLSGLTFLLLVSAWWFL